jgi:phenylalanyl-tRNA synthetase beta chain
MRIPLSWLNEHVAVRLAPAELGARLTMAGLELESLERVAPRFSKVVVARVVGWEKHPSADKLSVCRVDCGDGTLRQVVCGASNARAGLTAPLALIGAEVGALKIGASTLRGVESQGMLCSARELGLGDDHEGLLELDGSLALGTPLERALGLDDHVLELGVTANRGDCLSVRGVAREVAALTGARLAPGAGRAARVASKAKLTLKTEAPADCAVFAGRMITGIDRDARTPTWLRERLRRAGLRPIHPVVDVTNLVMLELGQPLHGYDAAQLDGGLTARRARAGERLTLLDGKEVVLDPEVLVIADRQRALGMAGVMGGASSAVSAATTDVFLESAWFAPAVIAGRARRFGLHTDAAQRFERGVDPTGQVRALERATQLLREIAGGAAGPVVEVRSTRHLPKRRSITLRRERLATLLGIPVPAARVVAILEALGCEVTKLGSGWRAMPPAWRFDLAREEDLVEEVGRVHGYDHIPGVPSVAAVIPQAAPERVAPLQRLREALADRGYDEAVTYSFVDPARQALLLGEAPRPRLTNPIAAEMAELRASLLTGLVGALQYNLARQMDRVRLFECGVRFIGQPDDFEEQTVIAGIAYGDALPRQWGVRPERVGFADLKADVEALLAVGAGGAAIRWVPTEHPALHPGQAAALELEGAVIGVAGSLHPRLLQALDLPNAPVFFEIAAAALRHALPRASYPSRFPRVKRDLAMVVDESVTAEVLLDAVRVAAGAVLAEVEVFDVYRGAGIDSGRKSVAMTLILQDSSRTLTDEESETLVSRVVAELSRRCGAVVRD